MIEYGGRCYVGWRAFGYYKDADKVYEYKAFEYLY
jgi:hypothetical protein